MGWMRVDDGRRTERWRERKKEWKTERKSAEDKGKRAVKDKERVCDEDKGRKIKESNPAVNVERAWQNSNKAAWLSNSDKSRFLNPFRQVTHEMNIDKLTKWKSLFVRAIRHSFFSLFCQRHSDGLMCIVYNDETEYTQNWPKRKLPHKQISIKIIFRISSACSLRPTRSKCVCVCCVVFDHWLCWSCGQ